MKIQCYMPVYNEADVLPYTLAHLIHQGVNVHVIDGWSTDKSFVLAQAASMAADVSVTVERFPASGPDPIQNCRAILHRIEDLAAASDADWILYSDADEWRRSSRMTETLAQGIARVDAQGYNAIDFRVFAFFCTDGAWRGDPEKYFRWYNETDIICRIPNRKLWKNVGAVSLAGGGHEVRFPGMRVCPQRWTMKHYPFRTPMQAREKLKTRLARRCKEEHAAGWGVHYDEAFPPGLLWNPRDLKGWADVSTALP